MSDPTRIDHLLDEAGRGLGIGQAAKAGRLWGRWAELVGPAVAEHAEPTSLREGVLRVRADSPAWAQEITYLAQDIKNKLDQSIGPDVVREIRVWTGPGPVRQRGSARAQDQAEPAPKPALREAAADPETALKRAWIAWRTKGSKKASSEGS